MKKVLFILAGATALALGVLGTVLPVLPTTPLLLLALYCFAKGSEKLNRWFQGTSIYKRYLAEYVQTKSLTRKQKLSVQIFAGMMMVISFMLIDNLAMRIVLALGFIIHNYVFLFRIKTRKSGIRNGRALVPAKQTRLAEKTNEIAL